MLAQELVDRMKNAMKHRVPTETVDRRADLVPGMRYRGERGDMVTILRSSQHRVVYQRDGYSGLCELSRYQFDLKFKKVRE